MIEDTYTRIQEKGNFLNQEGNLIIDGFALGDEISDGILVTDDKGYIIRVNKAYTKITGFKAEELIGQHTIRGVSNYISNPVSLLVLKEKRKIFAMSTIEVNHIKVLLKKG